MKYGSGKITKFHYGKMLAACLAYLILHQRDAVALGLFDSTLRDYTPRSDSRGTIHTLLTKLAAFESRVDDVLTVPFAPEELLARGIALVRRAYSDAVTFTPVIKLGELEIDILNRTVHSGTSELQLSSLEQSLLYLLAANAGRVVTREEILDTLWGVDYVAESNVVDRQIRNLRARLQDDWRQPRFIATVPGRGYRFLPTFTDSGAAIRTP